MYTAITPISFNLPLVRFKSIQPEIPSFEVGKSVTERYPVTDKFVVRDLFSDQIIHKVLATPYVVGFMESTARDWALSFLGKDKEIVGCKINITHGSPALVGDEVQVTDTLIGKSSRFLTFKTLIRRLSDNKIVSKGEIVMSPVDKATWPPEK